MDKQVISITKERFLELNLIELRNQILEIKLKNALDEIEKLKNEKNGKNKIRDSRIG